MSSLIALVVVFALFLGGLWILVQILEKQKASGTGTAATPSKAEPPLYVRQEPLMTKNEAAFFRVLRSAFGESYLIFAQLPLKAIVRPANTGGTARTTAMNKIDRKTVDFALVDPETMVVSVVIELNDSSHTRRDRQDRDTFVRDALSQAKVPFVEIPAAASYNAASLGPLLTTTRD